MTTITPITGWVLDAIIAHDEVCPGLAGHYFRASNERRQVIAAFLSSGGPNERRQDNIGDYLIRANHRSMLSQAYGSIPAGLRRALSKSGAQPHDASYYADLHDALAFGSRHVVTAIMHATRLSPERFEIIKALPIDLCDSRIVERIKDVHHARDLIAVVELFGEKAGSRLGLVDALIRSSASLEAVVRRWCCRLEYVDRPIEECVSYRPVRNGVELHEIARRYQNCGRNYSATALVGESAFGEYVAEDGRRVLICFDKTEGDWKLEGLYGRRNRSIAEDLATQARKFVSAHGIGDRWEPSGSDGDISRALHRLIQPYSEW